MTDVFIAYSSRDRAIALKLAKDLEAFGISVWCDLEGIGSAVSRGASIKRLQDSKVVIAIWTQHSVASDWFLDEADYARRQRKLLPVRVPDFPLSAIPLGFGALHTPILEIVEVLTNFGVSTSTSVEKSLHTKRKGYTDDLTQDSDIPRPDASTHRSLPQRSSWIQAALRSLRLAPQLRTRILFSYRRKDSIAITGRMYDRLVSHFGKDSIFMDIDSVPLGVDFREYLRHEILQCDIVLAVIGSGWLDEKDIYEKRKFDNPVDPVRLELEIAIEEKIPLVPVLVGETAMPRPENLPNSLQEFAFRNAAHVDEGRDFHPHMDRLIGGLEHTIKGARRLH